MIEYVILKNDMLYKVRDSLAACTLCGFIHRLKKKHLNDLLRETYVRFKQVHEHTSLC